MGAAQDTYKAMLRDQVAPTLRALGWKGSAGRFALPDPTHHLLVGFQGSAYSDSRTVSFTVNLATIGKAAWEVRCGGRKPSASTHGPIGVHHRLGILMPRSRDTWWDVSVGDDTGPLADLVCSAITQYGVPALRSARSSPEASATWQELQQMARGEAPS